MKITAIKCRAKDLKPGDLFSTAGPEYWNRDGGRFGLGVGEKVYVRTCGRTPLDQADDEVYRIEIERDRLCFEHVFRTMEVQRSLLETEIKKLLENPEHYDVAMHLMDALLGSFSSVLCHYKYIVDGHDTRRSITDDLMPWLEKEVLATFKRLTGRDYQYDVVRTLKHKNRLKDA